MFRNCTKLKVIRILLIVCLSLVFVQYLINLISYKYMTEFLNGRLSILAKPYNLSHSIFERINEVIGGNSNVGTPAIDSKSNFTGRNNRTTVDMSSSRKQAVNTTPITDISLSLCPLVPPMLVGPLATYIDAPSFTEIAKLHPKLSAGGRYKPTKCISRHRIAIIIPYRNRLDQLRVLLHNLHPMLMRQQLDYGIYVVNQALPSHFNRAMLMNIGYVEALKIYDYQCFFFHDVDLIPENDRNLYTCPDSPRHMSAAIDKFNYNLPYQGIFGGVSSLTKEQMEKVNGFSNKYFGWGGEDDDMYQRIIKNGLKISRYPLSIARYKMLKHGREKHNEVNKSRFILLNLAKKRMKTDGLNSLTYVVNKIEFRPLYTWIDVSINEDEIMKT